MAELTAEDRAEVIEAVLSGMILRPETASERTRKVYTIQLTAHADAALEAVAKSFEDRGCYGECGRMVDPTTGDQIHALMCPVGAAAEIRALKSTPESESSRQEAME